MFAVNKINTMKARLKESQPITRLSDMKVKQFAVVLDGESEGCIVYRPYLFTGVFAIDLTNGCYWDGRPKIKDFKVRILQAGEVIEITE